jgi:hypothetical protein
LLAAIALDGCYRCGEYLEPIADDVEETAPEESNFGGHQPCKVGHALNLRHRHGLVQEAHAEEITIEHITWCPSVATAASIAEDVRHRLGVSAGRAGWWNVEPAVAIAVVRRACAQFPSRGIIEHSAFIVQAASAGFASPAAARFA